jgi:hypothetical protein
MLPVLPQSCHRKGPDGGLLDTAIPKVAIAKDANYWDETGPAADPEAEVDLVALLAHMLTTTPLCRNGAGGTPRGG